MQNDPIARKIVHIEMIQSTIVRMADNGATMKRYAIVTFALGSAMARYLNVPEVLAVVAGVVVVFWYLDSKYLQQEKWYRDWYDVVRQGPSEYNHFQMTLDSNFKARTTMWYGLKSWELLSNLVFEDFRSCGDLVGFCCFNSVFEFDAGDDFGEGVKAA